jgi:hypothetical protein
VDFLPDLSRLETSPGKGRGKGRDIHVCPNGPIGIPSNLACVYSNQGKGRDPPQPVGTKQALNGFREFKIYLEVLGCPLNPNVFFIFFLTLQNHLPPPNHNILYFYVGTKHNSTTLKSIFL